MTWQPSPQSLLGNIWWSGACLGPRDSLLKGRDGDVPGDHQHHMTGAMEAILVPKEDQEEVLQVESHHGQGDGLH